MYVWFDSELSVEMWHQNKSSVILFLNTLAFFIIAVRSLIFPYETINWSRHPPHNHKITFGQGNDNADVVYATNITSRSSKDIIESNNVESLEI
jgi:hypothetical protein